MSARRGTAANVKPIVATIVGVPAAAIVLAAANGTSLPIVGAGAGAVIGVWVLGSVMCALGMSSMRERYGILRADLLGMPLGSLATVLLLSALLGWTFLLQPIADGMRGSGQPVTLERAAIVGVGAIMALKWGIAWLSYLPRRA